MEALITQYTLTKVEYDVLGRTVAAYMTQIRASRPLNEEEAALEGLFGDDIDGSDNKEVRIALRSYQYTHLVSIVAKILNTVGYRDVADYVLRHQIISEVILRLLYSEV